ncbi:hypothetical protein CLTEP_12670 [Clostridium tepidiprofundi DSM 19306]|uniref:Uncharacterized protein n=1 Tax=Clostridium tepidiprofundi DSM 19306 TaxID=1121338 RepID=A0A151B4W8_9CLOT|nr:hypothetical protein [Clostridium tepidiprofundi]KYH34802.1 hypothetical protein CLTEP_12670 [Clostridium tepidiprofundi DSM 19306]
MEYRLNKVDIEIRDRVKKTTKSGIVHSKKEIEVDSEQNRKKKDKNSSNRNNYTEEFFSGKASKITVEAIKEIEYKNIEIDAFKESINDNDIKEGILLDIRK